MRFTVLGHGALCVEHGDSSILVDPWLSGSCYWRSWWHYPPSEAAEAHLRPTHVYLTHHHFDHFHYPSMRRLDRGAHVLVPRFGVDVMPGEVRSLGFSTVTELAHGEVTTLAPGLRVASYQYGFDDSAFVIAGDDGTVLADLNDCKMRGASLRQVLDAPIVRITTPHVPLPSASALEDAAIPTVDRIVGTVTRTLEASK